MVRLLQVDFAVEGSALGADWLGLRHLCMDRTTLRRRRLGICFSLSACTGETTPEKTSNLQEGWINTALQGTLYGWPARPFMGFLGRVNGPADNLSSACLSCHARAQLPRARGGLAANPPDLQDSDAVRVHLDKYFQNVRAGTLCGLSCRTRCHSITLCK